MIVAVVAWNYRPVAPTPWPGDPSSQVNIAEMDRLGWLEGNWRKAAKGAHRNAHANLGVYFANKGDDHEAANWYWLASERGHVGAKYNLDILMREKR